MNTRTTRSAFAAVGLMAVAVGCQAPRGYRETAVPESLTLGQLSDLLTREGIKHHVDPGNDVIVTGYETKQYRDSKGGKHVRIILELSTDGKFLEMQCPGAYFYRGEFAREAAALCLAVNYRTRLVEVEYDPRDGEVTSSICLPLIPSQHSGAQIAGCLESLVYSLDKWDPAFRGVFDSGLLPRSAEIDRGLQELMEAFDGVFRGEKLPTKSTATRNRMI